MPATFGHRTEGSGLPWCGGRLRAGALASECAGAQGRGPGMGAFHGQGCNFGAEQVIVLFWRTHYASCML